jgi:three-Cys-motif partner protein
MLRLPKPQDDGLYVEKVGPWAKHKHHFLKRYLDAFTVAMRPKGWSGLHYIDLFAGPGICRIRDTGELDWGSALIAAQIPQFDSIHLCEKVREKHHALRQRLLKFALEIRLHHGDGNSLAPVILSEIPTGSLSVAFLDPYGLHLDFGTVRILAAKRIDLIIFFPDHLDALRNMKFVYQDQLDSNLDRFLGPDADWRSILGLPNERWAGALRGLYVEQLKKLGYVEFGYERICGRQRTPLYLLIFCSKHRAGRDIWEGVASKKADGQRTFEFD